LATTDLKLDEAGTLPKPGPVGRLVRILFASICLWYAFALIQTFGNLLDEDSHIRPLVWNGILPGLVLINYVINIGYSREWKKWPAIAMAAVFLMMAAFGYLAEGTVETIWLARIVAAFEFYLFSHLGIAFAISAVNATPGCELRAFHDLYSRLTGIPTKEHYCPIGPLHPIDRWESSLNQQNL